MSRTAKTLKFKMRWFANEGGYKNISFIEVSMYLALTTNWGHSKKSYNEINEKRSVNLQKCMYKQYMKTVGIL